MRKTEWVVFAIFLIIGVQASAAFNDGSFTQEELGTFFQDGMEAKALVATEIQLEKAGIGNLQSTDLQKIELVWLEEDQSIQVELYFQSEYSWAYRLYLFEYFWDDCKIEHSYSYQECQLILENGRCLLEDIPEQELFPPEIQYISLQPTIFVN